MDKCTLLFVFVCSLLRLVVWSRVKLVETQGWSKRVVVKVRGHEEGESIKLFSSAFTIKTPDSVGEGFRSKTTRKDEERQRHRKAAEKVTISWGAPPPPPSPLPCGGDWVLQSHFQTAILMLLPDWARKIVCVVLHNRWPTVNSCVQIWISTKESRSLLEKESFGHSLSPGRKKLDEGIWHPQENYRKMQTWDQSQLL